MGKLLFADVMKMKADLGRYSLTGAATQHAQKAHAALDELLRDALRPGYTGTAILEVSVKSGGIVGAPALTLRKLAGTEAK